MDIVKYKKLLKDEILRLEKKPDNQKANLKRIKKYNKVVALISKLQKQHNEKALGEVFNIINQNGVFARDNDGKNIFVLDMPVGVEMRVNKMYKECYDNKKPQPPVEMEL